MPRTLVRRFISLMVVVAAALPAQADDSVIGLPKPRDPQRPGAVLLFGGGGITNDAWDKFLELAGGPRAKIVIVPSAGFRASDYKTDEQFRAELESYFGAWLRLPKNGKAASVQFLYTDRPRDANDDAFIKPLADATGVWFSGGMQSRLSYRFVGDSGRATKFQLALRDVVSRGGVVGGTSAGMAALPEIMTHYQEYHAPVMTVVATHGLGLFDGAIVEQHFDGRWGRLDRFTGLLKDDQQLDKLAARRGASAKMIGLAVDERSGLVVQGNRLEAIGHHDCHVFIRVDGALAWHTLRTGTKAGLGRDRAGNAMLIK